MRRVAALVVLCVVAAGCGGDGGPPRQEYVAAVERELVELAGGRVRENARCIGEAAVDAVGLDQLADADVTPAEFTSGDDLPALEADESGFAVALEECDYAAVAASMTLRPGRSAVSDDARTCVADRLRADKRFIGVNTALFLGEGGDDDLEAILRDGLAACPEAASQLFIAGFASAALDEGLRPPVIACMNGLIRADPIRAATIAAADDQAAAEAYGVELGAACANAT